MQSDRSRRRRLMLSLALPTLLSACVIPGVMRYDEGIWITLRDGVSRDEARIAMTVAIEHLSPDDDYSGLAISVGKWHTPGMPTELDLQCRYSVNLDLRSGSAGWRYCVGENTDSGDLEVLTYSFWT